MKTTVYDMGYRMSYDSSTGSVSISREEGPWAGNGRFEDGRIVDCAAKLGDSEDESEDVYAALEGALKTALKTALQSAPITRLSNSFHGTYTSVRMSEDDWNATVGRIYTDDSAARRVRRVALRLCPSKGHGCTCSGPDGSRA